jgi:hypothetical protein
MLKQVVPNWHKLITSESIKWKFDQTISEPYRSMNHTTHIILLVYIYNIAGAPKSKIQLQR